MLAAVFIVFPYPVRARVPGSPSLSWAGGGGAGGSGGGGVWLGGRRSETVMSHDLIMGAGKRVAEAAGARRGMRLGSRDGRDATWPPSPHTL